MCSYPWLFEKMWQQVLDEIDSTIDIAYRMAHVAVPMRHSLANTGARMWELETTRYNEIHIVPLTAEDLALHDLSMVDQRGSSPVKTSTLHLMRDGLMDARRTMSPYLRNQLRQLVLITCVQYH